MSYDPSVYWNERINAQPNLVGTGNSSFDGRYNSYLYRLKITALEKTLSNHSVQIQGKSILDIGCGTGYFINYYKKRGARQITGIDIADASISLLEKKYPRYDFKTIDIGSKNVDIKNTFDLINVFDVIYHIVDSNRFENAISNISNMVGSGGHVLITDVFGPTEISPAEHVKFRSFHGYELLFNKFNIQILEVFPMYYLMNRGLFHLPSSLLNKICPIFYFFDKYLQNSKNVCYSNMNLLIGKKI